MEVRVNLALVVVLGLVWAGLQTTAPAATLDPDADATRLLAQMEDDFARDRANLTLARALSDRYLALGRPGLAIATLRAADVSVLDDPMLAHRLARAYESSGRLLDALATARLARVRCGRALGASDASTVTPVPTEGCTERNYAVLDLHEDALAHMVRWGVVDPARDERTATAYRMARRVAHVAAVFEPTGQSGAPPRGGETFTD